MAKSWYASTGRVSRQMLFADRSRTKKHGILLESPADDMERCKECDGVCCRSFPAVDISWEEFKQLKALGAMRLHFSFRGDYKLIIDNGCEFLVEGRCSIYEFRPDICRRFYCQDVP